MFSRWWLAGVNRIRKTTSQNTSIVLGDLVDIFLRGRLRGSYLPSILTSDVFFFWLFSSFFFKSSEKL